MQRGWKIGSLAGAPIRLSPSFALLALVLGVVFAPNAQELSYFGPQAWLLPVGYIAIFFVSVIVHEMAHATVGLLTGQRPSEIVVNVWGGHTQFGRAEESAGRSALIAGVGPITNLALAALAWGAGQAVGSPLSITGQLLTGAVVVNVLLGVFNLIPGLPLDGGHVLESAVWAATGRRANGTVAAGWVGRAIAAGLVLWAVIDYLVGARSVTFLLWTILIAFTLWQAASQALRFARVRRRADSLDLRQLVQPAVAVPADANLVQVVGALGAHAVHDPRFVVLVGPQGPVGVLDPQLLAQVPVEQHPFVTARQVARVYNPQDALEVNTTGDALLRGLSELTSESVVVTSGSSVIGVIPGRALIAALTQES
ncbi:MAG: site-2 protease family protein [Actinomycetales bacterium]